MKSTVFIKGGFSKDIRPLSSGWGKNAYQHSLLKYSFGLLILMLLIRLVSLAMYPLMDTTEARYAEMARIMFETGNWISPMFDYEVPFWGKPPMFAWLSAGGFTLFGVSEFAARLPHYIVTLGILALVWIAVYKGEFSKTTNPRLYAWFSVAILSSSAAFIISSGAVMTDAALVFSISLSMLSFWMAFHNKAAFWGYLFFIGLALGMLSKGPLSLVLVAMSLSIWLAFDKRFKQLPSCLPWFKGSLLFLAISMPWYILAEYKTPGFLNYFIVGEHFQRFLTPGWEGDLYGSAHEKARGTIWLYALLGGFPWTFILLWQAWKIYAKRANQQASEQLSGQLKGELNVELNYKLNSESSRVLSGHKGSLLYLFSWMLAPLLLFSFAGNILWTYVLPAMPPLAILVASLQQRVAISSNILSLVLILPILLLLLVFALNQGLSSKSSEKPLIEAWKNQPEYPDTPLVYLGKRPFSAQYYSQGKAQKSSLSITPFLEQQKSVFIAFSPKRNWGVAVLMQNGCHLRFVSNKRLMAYCSGSL